MQSLRSFITPRPYEPYEFAELAAYNMRISQGIVHTSEYAERMRAEQARFDQKMWARIEAEGRRARV